MKFQITVCFANNEKDFWEEDYDNEDLANLEEAIAWAQGIVDWYNSTLRAKELPRKLLKVEMLAAEADHTV